MCGGYMKKYFIILLCVFFLTGCQTNKTEENIDEQLYQQYQNYYTKLKSRKHFENETADCAVNLIVNQTNNNNIRYDVIIDNPQLDMLNIKAIALVVGEEKYNPPSIGLLEKDTFSLQPGVIDKDNGIYKGINLSGMTLLKKITVRLYFTYEKQDKLIERYIELHDNAS